MEWTEASGGVGKEKPRRAREGLRVAGRRPIRMDVGPMTHTALSKVIPTFLGWEPQSSGRDRAERLDSVWGKPNFEDGNQRSFKREVVLVLNRQEALK